MADDADDKMAETYFHLMRDSLIYDGRIPEDERGLNETYGMSAHFEVRDELDALEQLTASGYRDRAKKRALQRFNIREETLADAELSLLDDTYRAAWLLAPIYLKAVSDLTPILEDDIRADPTAKVAFLHRDGKPFSDVLRIIRPDFHLRNCFDLHLPRRIVWAACFDPRLDASIGAYEAAILREFVEDNFNVPGLSKEAAEGGYENLRSYLSQMRLLETSPLFFVDIGRRGTIQGIFALLFPEVDIRGRYLVCMTLPRDILRGKKKGILADVNLGESSVRQGDLNPLLPKNVDEMWQADIPVLVLESLFQGGLSSARRFKRVTLVAPRRLGMDAEEMLIAKPNHTDGSLYRTVELEIPDTDPARDVRGLALEMARRALVGRTAMQLLHPDDIPSAYSDARSMLFAYVMNRSAAEEWFQKTLDYHFTEMRNLLGGHRLGESL